MNPTKTIAILQSNYIPWKGYFDIIAAVDEFLIFDEAQFTRRDWRNRNKIVLDGILHWLTIPVVSKGKYHSPIDEMEVSEKGWAEKHWRSIRHAYGKAPFFSLYGPVLEECYTQAAALNLLTEINELFLRRISTILELTAEFGHTKAVPRHATTPTGRLVEICTGRKADVYISGPAARDYIQPAEFETANVTLRYANYSGYPSYRQAAASFEHGVSIVDTLMQCGPEARRQLKSIQCPGSLTDQP